MAKNKTVKADISGELQKGFLKARKKLIEKVKSENGYLIVGDKEGKVKKIFAKDL